MLSFSKLLYFLHWSFIRPIKLNIGALGALGIGAGTSLIGGLLGADATKDAARIAAEASRFAPIDITSGTGTTTFADGGFQSQLAPELQAVRDQLLGFGQQGLDTFAGFDPNQSAALFTRQLDELAQPQEQQQRLQLENRLFQQGLTGSTDPRTESLLSAQAIAQNQRNLQGLEFGQSQQDRLFQQALGGIQGATTLDASLANQLNQAISAGGANTLANQTGANFQFQAAQSNADALSGFFGGLGQGFTNLAFQQPVIPEATGASLFPTGAGAGGLFSSPARVGGF